MKLMWMVVLSGLMIGVSENGWGMPEREGIFGSLRRSIRKKPEEKAKESLYKAFKKAFPTLKEWHEITSLSNHLEYAQNLDSSEVLSPNLISSSSKPSVSKQKVESKNDSTSMEDFFLLFGLQKNPLTTNNLLQLLLRAHYGKKWLNFFGAHRSSQELLPHAQTYALFLQHHLTMSSEYFAQQFQSVAKISLDSLSKEDITKKFQDLLPKELKNLDKKVWEEYRSKNIAVVNFFQELEKYTKTQYPITYNLYQKPEVRDLLKSADELSKQINFTRFKQTIDVLNRVSFIFLHENIFESVTQFDYDTQVPKTSQLKETLFELLIDAESEKPDLFQWALGAGKYVRFLEDESGHEAEISTALSFLFNHLHFNDHGKSLYIAAFQDSLSKEKDLTQQKIKLMCKEQLHKADTRLENLNNEKYSSSTVPHLISNYLIETLRNRVSALKENKNIYALLPTEIFEKKWKNASQQSETLRSFLTKLETYTKTHHQEQYDQEKQKKFKKDQDTLNKMKQSIQKQQPLLRDSRDSGVASGSDSPTSEIANPLLDTLTSSVFSTVNPPVIISGLQQSSEVQGVSKSLPPLPPQKKHLQVAEKTDSIDSGHGSTESTIPTSDTEIPSPTLLTQPQHSNLNEVSEKKPPVPPKKKHLQVAEKTDSIDSGHGSTGSTIPTSDTETLSSTFLPQPQHSNLNEVSKEKPPVPPKKKYLQVAEKTDSIDSDHGSTGSTTPTSVQDKDEWDEILTTLNQAISSLGS